MYFPWCFHVSDWIFCIVADIAVEECCSATWTWLRNYSIMLLLRSEQIFFLHFFFSYMPNTLEYLIFTQYFFNPVQYIYYWMTMMNIRCCLSASKVWWWFFILHYFASRIMRLWLHSMGVYFKIFAKGCRKFTETRLNVLIVAMGLKT